MKTYVFYNDAGEIKHVVKTSDLSQYAYKGLLLELPADAFVDASLHRIVSGLVVEKEQSPAVDEPPTREQQESARQVAFQAEADPLFFKWQAGEGTKEDWEAKREEIRQRYPYPNQGE